MYLHIPGLLNAEQLDQIEPVLSGATFVDGSLTAGNLTKPIKKNLELDRDKTEKSGELKSLVSNALWRNTLFRAAAMPTRITPPIFNKHETGMFYGPHTDNPITGRTPGVRADLAVSIFLSDPEKYDGGAVAIRTDGGEIKFRLPRGDALVYPSGVIHTIEEITSGTRYAAVLWLQSVVVDSNQRQILFELDRAAVMVNEKAPQSEESRLLIKAYGNLMRMWAAL